jgi:hypothetical protein
MKFDDYLGKVVFVEPVFEVPGGNAWRPAPGWEWMTEIRIRRLPEGHDYDLRALQTRPYFAVIRAFDKSLPEPWVNADDAWRRGKGALVAAVHYRPGTFRGAIFVMDVRSAQLVCQVPLEAQSSPRVDDPGTLDADARGALTWDFEREIVRGSRAALGRISRVLRIDWGEAPFPER